MKKLLVIVLSAPLFFVSCTSKAADPKSAAGIARDNVEKAKNYHELASKSKVSQADLQTFVENWSTDCKSRGSAQVKYQLQMGNDGDPGCAVVPETPSAPQQAPQVPAKK